ncbi:MAG: hypothetical protein ACOC31_02675 [Bacteroidota bacterium]
MRVAFLIIVLFHGLIHLLGFIKGFDIKEVKELTLPITKPMASLWLAAAVFIITFGILHILNSKYAWLAGLVAVVMSVPKPWAACEVFTGQHE